MVQEKKGSTEEPQNGIKFESMIWNEKWNNSVANNIKITLQTKLKSFQCKIFTVILHTNMNLSRWNAKNYNTWVL